MRTEVTWPTIPAMVRDAARRHGTAEAVVDGTRRIGYVQLCDMVTDAARALLASGIERGDRVAVWAPNSLEWIVAALGVTTAGGVLVPVNTRFRGAEAAYVLARSGARVLFTVRGFLDTDYPALLAKAGVELPALEHTVLLAGDADDRDADADADNADGRRSRGTRSSRAARRFPRPPSPIASRRSAPTTRATSCSRREPPATPRAWS